MNPTSSHRMTKGELSARSQALVLSAPDELEESRESEFLAVLQELETHQVELEMQNHELRASREALEESQSKYVDLYDFAPTGYVTLTAQGLIEEINLTAATLFGVERQYLIGRSLAPWIHSADLVIFRNHLRKCHTPDGRVNSRLHIRRRDGHIIPVDLVSTHSLHPTLGKLMIRTTLSDLSERLEMENSLRVAVSTLQDEKEMRERFVSALTHDLRTPLTAVKIASQLLVRSPAMTKELSLQIQSNIDRIDQMIQDLLDANLIRAGEKLHLRLTEVDVVQVAKETLESLRSVHGDRFVLKAPNRLPAHLNEPSLRRIIENLANNAVKYGSAETPITITLQSSHKRSISLAVHNLGNPIPPMEQASLFLQFKRGSTADKPAQKGWGLGLTLVRGLAEAQEGQINVESSASRGTTFRVVLPNGLVRVNLPK